MRAILSIRICGDLSTSPITSLDWPAGTRLPTFQNTSTSSHTYGSVPEFPPYYRTERLFDGPAMLDMTDIRL